MSFPHYPKYKKSGVEWLGEVPEHWAVDRLKRHVQLATTKTDRRKYVVALENVESWTGRLIATETEFEGEGIAFVPGDVLFGKLRPYLAKVFRAPVAGEAIGDFHVMRPDKRMLSSFLQYRLLSQEMISIIDGSTFGSKMPRASWEFVGQLEIGLPPASEQQSISGFLDLETAKIDALRVEQQRLIQLLEEKRQAIISHTVTKGLNPEAAMKPSGVEWLGVVPAHWRIGKCGRHLSLLSGFAFPSDGFSDDETATRLLRGVNVGVSALRWDDTEYWKRERGDGLDCYELGAGDLVIGMDRPLISGGIRVARVSRADLPCLLLQRVARLKTDAQLEASYLMRLLASEMFAAHFAPETTGVSVPHISPEQIASFVIPVPPVNEQQQIVHLLERTCVEIDALIAAARGSMDCLLERRSALISAAVTGQIDVRVRAAVAGKKYSSGFARQLLAAEILTHCHDHPTMGRVKLQKLIHLCEHVAEIGEIGGAYSREAAGPFDTRLMHGIAAGLAKQKWFSEVKNEDRSLYRPLARAGEHSKYLEVWRDRLPRIGMVIQLLGTATTQQCEIVSTLYAAWNDLLIDGRCPSDVEIIHEASSPQRWHASKSAITSGRWASALSWMRTSGVIPVGFGRHTVRGHEKRG